MGYDNQQSNTSLSLIERSIDNLAKNFQQYPDNYFSECELQYELYFIIKSLREFNLTSVTIDGKDIKIVHPEYPSVNRVQLNKGKGYRVWFDLAILNPSFVENNSYRTVLAKNEKDAKFAEDNLLAAFEFKFFSKYGTNNILSVVEDCRKLSICPEIVNRYVLAFSSYEPNLSELQAIDVGETILFWITPINVQILK